MRTKALYLIAATVLVTWVAVMVATTGTNAQTIMATPVPETPTPADISALVDAIVAILRQIVADIIRGVLEPVAVVIGR